MQCIKEEEEETAGLQERPSLVTVGNAILTLSSIIINNGGDRTARTAAGVSKKNGPYRGPGWPRCTGKSWQTGSGETKCKSGFALHSTSIDSAVCSLCPAAKRGVVTSIKNLHSPTVHCVRCANVHVHVCAAQLSFKI